MNQWPFIVAAYLLTIGATAGLGLVSYWSMRRAEDRSDRVSRG